MLIGVRHGSTLFNEDPERFDGWLPLVLNKSGEAEASLAADKIKDLVGDEKIHSFLSSDILRNRQTSDIISRELNIPYQRTSSLRTLNSGFFQGKYKSEYDKDMKEYVDNPDEVIPKGESYNDFYDRIEPVIKPLIESNKINLATISNGVASFIRGIALKGGKGFARSAMKSKGPLDPGGIMVVNPDWSFHTIE